MRNLMVAAAAVVVVGSGLTLGSRPAAAHDYPWCAVGGGLGYPGECYYTSYAQCQASASGRRVWCNINPRIAFGQARSGQRAYPGYPDYYRW